MLPFILCCMLLIPYTFHALFCFVLCVGRFRFFHSCFFRLHSCLSSDRFSRSFGLDSNTGNNSNLYAQFAEALTEIITRKTGEKRYTNERTNQAAFTIFCTKLFARKQYVHVHWKKPLRPDENEQIRIEWEKGENPTAAAHTHGPKMKWNRIAAHEREIKQI